MEIKHDFLCINICWAPRKVLKPEPERWGFQHHPRGQADVIVSEKHVWSLLLHKTFFSLENFGESFHKALFTCTYNGAENTLPANVLKTPAKFNVIATVHFTDDDVSFNDDFGMLIRKTAKLGINSMWLALLIHGFVLVKTWLLIAYDTDFYAIICNYTPKQISWPCWQSITRIYLYWNQYTVYK